MAFYIRSLGWQPRLELPNVVPPGTYRHGYPQYSIPADWSDFNIRYSQKVNLSNINKPVRKLSTRIEHYQSTINQDPMIRALEDTLLIIHAKLTNSLKFYNYLLVHAPRFNYNLVLWANMPQLLIRERLLFNEPDNIIGCLKPQVLRKAYELELPIWAESMHDYLPDLIDMYRNIPQALRFYVMHHSFWNQRVDPQLLQYAISSRSIGIDEVLMHMYKHHGVCDSYPMLAYMDFIFAQPVERLQIGLDRFRDQCQIRYFNPYGLNLLQRIHFTLRRRRPDLRVPHISRFIGPTEPFMQLNGVMSPPPTIRITLNNPTMARWLGFWPFTSAEHNEHYEQFTSDWNRGVTPFQQMMLTARMSLRRTRIPVEVIRAIMSYVGPENFYGEYHTAGFVGNHPAQN